MKQLLLLLVLLLAQSSLAAMLTGTAYTQELQFAKFSVLTINTTPAQRIILEDGTYNITVSRGSYLMRVELNSKGKLYDDELAVDIKDSGFVRNNGNYTYDFVLFPSDANASKIPMVDDVNMTEPEATVTTSSSATPWALILIPLAAVVLLSTLMYRRKRSTPQTVQEAAQEAKPLINPDLEQVLKLLKQEGGRTTQKELRKHIACSEAKLSMMLTELEASGKITKIKKGRGNLLVLKG